MILKSTKLVETYYERRWKREKWLYKSAGKGECDIIKWWGLTLFRRGELYIIRSHYLPATIKHQRTIDLDECYCLLLSQCGGWSEVFFNPPVLPLFFLGSQLFKFAFRKMCVRYRSKLLFQAIYFWQRTLYLSHLQCMHIK